MMKFEMRFSLGCWSGSTDHGHPSFNNPQNCQNAEKNLIFYDFTCILKALKTSVCFWHQHHVKWDIFFGVYAFFRPIFHLYILKKFPELYCRFRFTQSTKRHSRQLAPCTIIHRAASVCLRLCCRVRPVADCWVSLEDFMKG